jgi:hypothetical protein
LHLPLITSLSSAHHATPLGSSPTITCRDLDLIPTPAKTFHLPHLKRLDLIGCTVPITWWMPVACGRAAPRMDKLTGLRQLSMRRNRFVDTDKPVQRLPRLRWRLPASLEQLAFVQEDGRCAGGLGEVMGIFECRS